MKYYATLAKDKRGPVYGVGITPQQAITEAIKWMDPLLEGVDE